MGEPFCADEPLWTVKDLEKVLNVKHTWIYDLVERGLIPHLRLGGGSRGAIRFEPADIRAWKAQRKHRALALATETGDADGEGL